MFRSYLRTALLLTAALACVLIATRFVAELRLNRDRTHLVATLVQEQVDSLKTLSVSNEIVRHKNLPDDCIELQRWLISQWASRRNLASVSSGLASLIHGHTISPSMKRALVRWQNSLQRWNERMNAGPVSADAVLTEARLRYSEAKGYAQIGRNYDASVLFLWTTALVERYISESPAAPDAPEALYLLGASFLQLRHVISPEVRSERILNACMDLFPESLWARHAENLLADERAKHAV